MKKFVSGFLIAAVLFGSATVYAGSGRMIEVFDHVKKIVVDKVERPFDTSNAPFVHNGTTYVPLRFVADALGEPVDWDNKTGTIRIGEMENAQAHYFGTNLKHSLWDEYYTDYSYSHGVSNNIETSNMGNKYSNYLTFYVPSAEKYFGELTFPLNGQYSSFSAILGCTDDYTSGKANVKLTILLDGKEAYSKVVKTGMLEEPLKINTKGALNITFKVQGMDESEKRLEIGLFNGEFLK